MHAFRTLAVLLSLSTLLVLTGCGGGEIYVAANYPPEMPLPQNIRTIAITPFVGHDSQSRSGADMACGLLASKLTASLGSTGQYAIVERGNLKDVMTEQDMAAGGITDAGTAARAGKILNADALIFGTVQVQQSEDIDTTVEQTLNSRGQMVTTEKTKLRRTGLVTMTTKMVNPETAEVIISKTATHTYDSNNRGGLAMFMGDNSSVPAPEMITRTLLEECVGDFYRTISPHTEYFQVKLAGGKTPPAKAGVDMVKAGEFQLAVRQFEDGITLDPTDHGTVYNLAVVQMLTGDIAAAKANVEKAMLMKPDKKYIAVNGHLSKAAALGGQASFRAATGQEVASFKSRQELLKASR